MDLLHDCLWLEGKINETEIAAIHGSDTKNDFYPAINHGFVHPYSPTWCMERVLLDNRYSVGTVIRGIDLISEFSLYTHFCRQLKYPPPVHQYVTHLSEKAGNEIRPVSKTNKNALVCGLIIKGVSSHQLLDFLKTNCLKDPKAGWKVENVKPNPVIDLSKL
jgi:glutamyl/glutaminyl-tRNA synthetase